MSDHGVPLPHAPGEVRLSAQKMLWNGALLLSCAAAPWFWDPGAVLFTGASAVFVLAVGHSAGFHRGVIHGSYRMGRGTEGALVYLAVLAGLGGPLAMMRMHNTRDRWQNRAEAPNYYTFAHSALCDAVWYLFCEHRGAPAPIDEERSRRPWYRFLEQTWPLHHLGWAVALYLWGGPAWMVWGAGVRAAVCVLGHWYVNYAAHTVGYRRWRMPGSGEEGRNHLWFGALAMGEGWHNNHHAWPDSAQIGLAPWEFDPGWWVVCALRALGLVWDVKTVGDGATLRPGAQPTGVRTFADALADSRAPTRVRSEEARAG